MQNDSLQGYRLSAQQEWLWQLQKADGGPGYRVSCAVTIDGALPGGALEGALRELVERYEILRTTFQRLPGLELPLQVVAEALAPAVRLHDWSGIPEAEQASRMAALAEEMARLPFDPAAGPQVHAAIVTLGPARHRLLLELPALCADAPSLDSFLTALGAALAGGDAGEEPAQYIDISEWQSELLEAPASQEGRRFWQGRAARTAAGLGARLPWEEEGGGAAGPFAPRELQVPLSPDLAAGLAALAGEVGAPVQAVLLAAWNVLLDRLAGSAAAVVGVAAGGRSYSELQGSLGPLTRYLPFALEVRETEPFLGAVARAARQVMELERWQEYFHWDPPAEGGRPYLPFGFEWIELPARYGTGTVSLTVERLSACVDRFALKLSCLRRGEELALSLGYDESAGTREHAERVVGWLLALLGGAVATSERASGDLPLLSEAERLQLDELSRTAVEHGRPETLDGLFAAQAELTPDRVALVAGPLEMSYGELLLRAWRLAGELRRLGVGPEVRVGLAVERSAEMVIGMLGILAAGGAYVPLDPDYPLERQRFVLEDSRAAVLLTTERLAERLPAPSGGVICLDRAIAGPIPEGATPLGGRPEHLAYVIYTSGSTGQPKGVMVTHRAITNRLSWMQRLFPLTPDDRVLQKTAYSFDASIWEVFVPLLAGARLVLAEPGAQRDPALLAEAIAAHGVTVLQLVPSQVPGLLAVPDLDRVRASLRRLFCGGEALPGALAREVAERLGVELHNLYGPTEAAIDATCRPFVEAGAGMVAIGRPLDNVEVFVADDRQRLVPPGLPGELLIGGRGLARGYLGRPELTAERFVPHLWSGRGGERLYRTGDLVRFGPGGEIWFLGRLDHQVKVRGFRIELGEIEAALLSHPWVREAAVVVREETAGDARLTAYVAGEGLDGQLFRLPNGMEVAYLNRGETEVVYRETFGDSGYLKHGIRLDADATVFDVGANIGLFSLWVKANAPHSRIYAFEPIPPIFEVLRTNMLLYGLDVELVHCGLMSRDGTARFGFYPQWSAMSGAYADPVQDEAVTREILRRDSELASQADDLLAGRFRQEVFDCQVRTLSQVIRERGLARIDLLKIDVEKAELDVLHGLADEDWGKIHQIVIEVHDFDERVEQIRRLLEDRGFVVTVDQDPELAGTGMYNLYAVHPLRQSGAAPVPASTEPRLAMRLDLSPQGLRDYLAERLPQHMVPQAFVILEALPRQPNGKLDRRALPEPGAAVTAPVAEPVAPRNPVEEIVAGLWAEVLQVERVGAHDDFFELGGHSLLATQMIARVRECFRVEVKIRALFEASTVARFAAAIEAARRDAAGTAAPPIQPVPRGGELPLSFSQQRLWFLEQLEGHGAVYNLPTALLLTGPLDMAALRAALDEIVSRHESLRTCFPTIEGRPVQEIAPPGPIPFPLVDLRHLAEVERRRELRAITAENTLQPFDLAQGPLLRAALVRLAEAEHAVLLTLHHTISDGSSFRIFVDELVALYGAFTAGQPSPLPPLPIQLADYACWQREWLTGPVLEAELGYWRKQLAGAPPLLELPADHPRPAAQSFAGQRQPFAVAAGLTADLRALGHRRGATLFMTLLGAFQALLSRYSGQEDVPVGTPIANRHHPQTERLIGCFANTLVLRTELSGDPSFAELLGRVREVALGAYAHQDMPFEMLVNELQPERDLSRSPLFQVFFSLLGAPRERPRLAGIEVRQLPIESRTSRFDLSCDLYEGMEGLSGSFEHSTALFEPASVERLAGHYRTLLAGVAAAPGLRLSELPLLSETERQQLLVDWQGASTPYPDRTIHELFEERAASSPELPAVVWRGEEVSYGELDRRANRLAHRLLSLGVRPDEPVGVCLERSVDMVVALLAVLKAGAPYLPLDPAYPPARLALMAGDAGARVVLTEERLLPRLPGEGLTAACLDLLRDDLVGESDRWPASGVTAGNLAYVIYTSGSTGAPKGVMVSHRNVVSFFAGMDAAIGGSSPGTWLAVTSISFDISVLELLWTLTRGFRIVVQGEREVLAAATAEAAAVARPIDFSLFYFAKAESEAGGGGDPYRLLLEGARFADHHGFTAVWTPERHFHDFGGLYPSPAVTSAAIATITERVQIRAGSVVLPLHHPIRVAEEWAMIDNLSRGRTGISFASGWHADDFVFAPESYARRKAAMLEGIDVVRRLWRGEAVPARGGAGREVAVRILPRPVQPELPVWVTAAGNVETFRQAGEVGAGVLTHLLGQDLDELEEKVAAYRRAWREGGHRPGDGHVVLMLHTFIGEDQEAVRRLVKRPFCNYLRSSLDLLRNLSRSTTGQEVDPHLLSAEDLEDLLERSFDRYFDTAALLGTTASCLPMVERLQRIGVDEVACLIDFGVDVEAVLDSLRHLDALRQLANRRPVAEEASGPSIAQQIVSADVTHLQCTPTLARLLASDPASRGALGTLERLLVGGEALPPSLLDELRQIHPAAIHNMYGPTETTVWSSTWAAPAAADRISIGRPIANTQIYAVDPQLQPLPAGVPGELLIGGPGVTRGYHGRPDLTAERFVPDPYGPSLGGRLYRTGDRARRLPDGEIEILGRLDHQVKVHGHRIELAEIEHALERHPAIAQTVVVAREEPGGNRRLAAYFVPAAAGAVPVPSWTGRYHRLPNGMRVACLNDFQASQAYREVFESAIYLRHGIALEDGDCVFDVGANVGFFSLFASRRAKDLAIYAFEPIPVTFQALSTNVSLHGVPAEVLPVGVGERVETVQFTFYPQMPGLSGRYASAAQDREATRAILLAGMAREGARLSDAEIEDLLDEQFRSETYLCPVRTLSDVIDERGIEVIDLLKVDVERAELDVLRGLRPEHWSRVRQLAMEVDGRESLNVITELLHRHGFAVTVDDFVHVPTAGEQEAVAVFMLYARRDTPRPFGARRRPLALSAADPLSFGELRAYLAQSLPEHMLPGVFMRLAALPLTANGKVDRKALPAPVPGPAPQRDFAPPLTPVEQLLAGLWQDLLRVPRVGRYDSFFELGGDSLLSIQLIARARQVGLHLTPRQLFQHQTVAELASVVTPAPAAGVEEVGGPVGLTPIQHWFFEQELPAPQHWNHALLMALRPGIAPRHLASALAALLGHHDALRLRFRRDPSGWSQEPAPWDGDVPWLHVDLSGLPPAARARSQAAAADGVHASLDLQRGPLARFALFARGEGQPDLLLLVIHHLAVDGLSWRILLEDLGTALEQFAAGRSPRQVELLPVGASFSAWAEHLARQAEGPEIAAELPFWLSLGRQPLLPLPVDHPGGDNLEGSVETVSVWLEAEPTRQLLQQVPAVYRTQVNDALLTALALGFAGWTGQRSLLVDLEGHGREEIGNYLDVSRTVGWFSTFFPVLLDLGGARGPGEALKTVKEQLRRIPNRGVGYGLLRYGGSESAAARQLRALPASLVSFNYLGQLDQAVAAGSSPFLPAAESSGTARDPRQPRRYLLDVNGEVRGGRLRLGLTYSRGLFAAATIERLAAACMAELQGLIAHCLSPEAGGPTPSDFPLAGLDQTALDRLAAAHPGIDDILPLTTLQQGLLFHSLEAQGSPVYLLQLSCRVLGDLDPALFELTWQRVMERHSILRSCFVWEGLDEPLQIICRNVHLPCQWLDWRGLDGASQELGLADLLAEHRREGLDVTQAPLMRIAMIRTGPREHRLVWTHHHLLVDAWSVAVVVAEVCALYPVLAAGAEPQLPPPGSYRDYVQWQRRQPLEQAEDFWRGSLAGITAPTSLGIDRPDGGLAAGEPTTAVLTLTEAATAELRTTARRLSLTLNTLVLGAWTYLLGLLGGEEEVVLGVVSSGREADLPGIEGTVGVFINTLPLRASIRPSVPLAAWLRGLQERQVEMRRFGHAPLVEVHGWSEVPRGLPLFESIFIFQGQPLMPVSELLSGRLEVRDVQSLARTNYPLALLVGAGVGEELRCEAVLDGGRFDPAWADRLLGYLQRLLVAFAADPERPLGRLPLLDESEQRALLAAPREPGRPEQCLHQIFAVRAAASPEAIAVCYENERLTYGQLNGRANRLARYLVGLGVSPGDVVGLSVERSLEMVVGILGILKAGAAYLPLDPAQPTERLAFMLGDADVEVLLTEERLRGALPPTAARIVSLDAERAEIERCREDDLVLQPSPESLAYVIYTSGSTGRPKGVLVSHANVVRLFTASRELFDFDAQDVWSLFHSFAFDFSVWELWGALLFGGRLVVVPYWSARVPEELYRLLVNERVTVLNQIPSAFQRLIQVDEEKGEPLALRWVIFGGEALAPDTLAGWLARHGNRQPRLVNMYGITETTVHVTWREVRAADVAAGGSPIGGPLPDLELYVASRFAQPVPAMVAGELYVGGAGLSWGYLGRPELTAERFVPDPWSGRPGSRLYRTGDLARRLPDGDIDYLGRTDHQIKLRGFRIELGEIEAALRRHPAVSEAIVVAGGGLLAGSAARLVAHVVPTRGQVPTAGALREWLLQELPEPMVPAAFVLLDELPRTASGKLDRRALAAPSPARAAREDAAAPPRTAVEEMVAGIWAEVLHLDRVGAGDSFLALGGHSLLATQVVSRIRQAFRVDLPLRDLFEAPTLAELAARIEALRRTSAGVVAPPLRHAVRDRELPLSFAQQRLWFLDQLGMAGPAYHIPADLRIAGRLDIPALAHGLSEIVRRHESLRTIFPRDHQAQIVQEPRPVPLPVVDLGVLPDGAQQAEAHRLAREELRRPFDLTQDLLVRAGLLRLAPEEHVLLLTLHHIASDGWSAGVLVREMAVLYPAALRGEARPLPELSIQYADYACWQRDWLRGEVLERELAYWRGRLAGAPQAIELATDRPRPAVATFGGAVVGRELPRDEAAALQALARRQGVTLFMVLLAAFQALLHRRGGQQDLSIGTPVAGRNHLETEGLIGFLVNTLVLRGDLRGAPRFADLLEQARDTVLDAQAHQDLPFEKIVEVLQPERNLSRTPLFQVMLALQSSPQGEVEPSGLRLQPVSAHAGASKFDLTLEVVERPAGLTLSAEYSTDLFDHGTVARLLDGFRILLQGAMTDPLARLGDLPLLTAAERHQLLIEWAAKEAVADGARPLHELFEAEVERRPDAEAVAWLDHRLSYRELDRRANRLANCLRSLGVGPEVRVGLCAERSLDLVVGILGILKAGGAYVPLDPAYPKERLAFLVEDSRTPVVVTEEALVERLAPCGAHLLRLDADAARIEQWSADRPASQALPDNAAYVIYTSGSTGTPKGVVVTHRNVTRLFAATHPWFQPDASDVWALFHSFAFDFSVWELWGALLHGGRLVIVPYATSRAPEAFYELLREERVTVLNQTPSAFRQLIHSEQARPATDDGLALRLVIFGGEALDLQSLRPWLERHGEAQPRLVNMYGITETTVHVTYREVGWADLAAASASVIGVPIPDLAVHVLDGAGQPVPSGVPGEIYVGGAGLARGYLGRPALSAERFVPNPFGGAAGERLYRSGDLGRYRAGRRDLEYLGRVDLQVKVRGFRIELGEIEAALGACPGVRETVVLVREDVPGEPRLVAYVVPAAAEPPTAGQLRGALLDKLPDYMVPALFVMLDALPLTEHGKVDRRALPAADGAERASDEVYVTPETPLQDLLATIWAEVLGVERVGIDDNFFALGGDSMRTLRVLTMVRERGLDFSLQQIYRHQTVRELAQAIAAELSLDEATVVAAPAATVAPEEDLDQMLAELEGLSPDEVRAELQQELARKRGATE